VPQSCGDVTEEGADAIAPQDPEIESPGRADP